MKKSLMREVEERVWHDMESKIMQAYAVMQSDAPCEDATLQARDTVACCHGAISYLQRLRAGLEQL